MCQATDGKGSNIPKAHQLELEYEPNELEHLCGHHDDEELSGNCGRAIIRELKRTVGTWWFKEMTNFNLKTIATSFVVIDENTGDTWKLEPSAYLTPRQMEKMLGRPDMIQQFCAHVGDLMKE